MNSICFVEMKQGLDILCHKMHFQKIYDMVETFKNCIETREARATIERFGSDDRIWPALSYISFSSNAPPPKNPGFRAKVITKVFTQKDSHTEEQKKEFLEFMRLNAHKLRLLGNFAITYLLLHPEVLFKAKIEEIDWEAAAKEVITKFYEMAGIKRRR